VEFRAGKMTMKGSTVTSDKRTGQVYIQQTDYSLIHFCWNDWTSGNVDDLIIFPDDCEFKRVNQCTTKKYVSGESKTDKDEEYCRKVNEYLNNPTMPGHSSVLGEGGLQSLLGNMSHNQLMQLIGRTGLGGGLGALAGPGLASLLSSGGLAACNSSSSLFYISGEAMSPMASPATPVAPSLTAGAASPNQSIQLSDLQSILATMNVPAAGQGVNLDSVVTPEIMAPILANAEVQERPCLRAPTTPPHTHLPSFSRYTTHKNFSISALASGQLGPLMNQFGLPTEAVDAANKGDIEAFAKAMETDSKSDHEDNDSKDKEDDKDMSLD
uniref:ADRM1 26S proteasome ubiquitin receptor n=1 Tax=Oncorhynchus kisutch TaxID=8019 RepID=A0A8C7M4W8_ONCKI